MKKLLLASSLIFLFMSAQSQSTKIHLGLQRAIGLSSQHVTIGNNTNEMDLTSMAGLEAAISVDIVKNMEIRAGMGYFLNFGASKTVSNGSSSSASQSFNIKRLNIGVAKTFDFENKKSGIRIGGGFDFNFPGKLNVKNNSSELGRVKYKNSRGFYVELAVPVEISDKISIAAGIKYRSAKFNATSHKNGDVVDLNNSLKKLNANALELGISVAIRVGPTDD